MVEKDLVDRIISSYATLNRVSKILKEDSGDYIARELLGSLREEDPHYYAGTEEDVVRIAADEEVEKSKRDLEKNVSYSNLTGMYDNRTLKKILDFLPPLNDGGHEELAKAHKELYGLTHGYEEDMESMRKSPEEIKRKVEAYAKDGATAYMARASDEDTRKIIYGRVLEARRKLYQIIDKIKPAEKK